MPAIQRKGTDPNRAAGSADLAGAYAEGDARRIVSDTIAVPEANSPPVLDLDSGAPGSGSSASFTEGNGPVTLAPSGTVADPDSPDFDGATLTVQFISGAQAEDMLVVVGLDPDSGGFIYNGNGDVIAQVTGGDSSSNPLVVTFTAFAGASDVQNVLRTIGYVDYSYGVTSGDRLIGFTLTDGDGGTSNPATATVHVSATDVPPTASDDFATTDEASTVVIAVLANDSDPDGPPPSVATVDGKAIAAGQTVIIASGAKVTLGADGTLTYDPNHRFDTLTSPSSGETGAVNTSATDSFSYGLAGGTTASVVVTVNGVASAQDHLDGDAGDNNITGTGNGDYFDLSQGGDDTASGLGGDDGFYFGRSGYTSADVVDGGAGGNDQLGLDGDYGSVGSPLALGGNVTNVEVVVLLPGAAGTPNHFNVTTTDAFVGAGQTETIFALQTTTGMVFDGSHEHDGAFKIYGGSGADTITGSDGNDWIFGGNGGDTLTGGLGSDTFYYDAANQSTSTTYDKIIGFDDNTDKIDLPFAVTGFAAPTSGNLSTASFDADLSSAFAGLTSHQAGMFTATGGSLNGHTFLVVDADGVQGYQAGSDYVIEIVSPATPVDNPAIFV
ncbi:MAG: hypothetical protein JO276_10395 [Sphingomonadaceae bacterium]|nr:hypothetical protein [Sphingomonadaceae bacterium]